MHAFHNLPAETGKEINDEFVLHKEMYSRLEGW